MTVCLFFAKIFLLSFSDTIFVMYVNVVWFTCRSVCMSICGQLKLLIC